MGPFSELLKFALLIHVIVKCYIMRNYVRVLVSQDQDKEDDISASDI